MISRRTQTSALFAVGLLLILALASATSGCKDSTSTTPAADSSKTGIKKVGHVIVFYLENHSFDNLYGEFPGADGFAGASTAVQTDSAGKPFSTLPALSASSDPNGVFPKNLPNQPFNIDQYAAASLLIPDLVHRYYQEQAQIDGGKMDKFALVSNAKALSMGYYHTAQLPMFAEVKNYTLCDRFFHSAFGGSFLNHMYLISAAAPVFKNAPAKMVAKLDANGKMTSDGQVTPDGYVVNTSFTVNTPHPPAWRTDPATLVPNQTMPTIGDRLSQAGVSWAWYSGGWNAAVAGHPDTNLFQYHHQPFAYFANFADGTQAKADHLKDETDFVSAVKAGTLPAVSFVKPFGADNEHPGYANVTKGEQHLDSLITLIRNSPNWNDCVIIITYDENGGFWDHVAPPTIDAWGPGTRVPGIVISPFAKKGYVDHTPYETMSILSFIEKRWGLQPLGTRDAAANPFTNALQF